MFLGIFHCLNWTRHSSDKRKIYVTPHVCLATYFKTMSRRLIHSSSGGCYLVLSTKRNRCSSVDNSKFIFNLKFVCVWRMRLLGNIFTRATVWVLSFRRWRHHSKRRIKKGERAKHLDNIFIEKDVISTAQYNILRLLTRIDCGG